MCVTAHRLRNTEIENRLKHCRPKSESTSADGNCVCLQNVSKLIILFLLSWDFYKDNNDDDNAIGDTKDNLMYIEDFSSCLMYLEDFSSWLRGLNYTINISMTK